MATNNDDIFGPLPDSGKLRKEVEDRQKAGVAFMGGTQKDQMRSWDAPRSNYIKPIVGEPLTGVTTEIDRGNAFVRDQPVMMDHDNKPQRKGLLSAAEIAALQTHLIKR